MSATVQLSMLSSSSYQRVSFCSKRDLFRELTSTLTHLSLESILYSFMSIFSAMVEGPKDSGAERC